MASIRPRRFFRLPDRSVSHVDSTSNSTTPSSSNGDTLPSTATATGGNSSNNNHTNSYFYSSFSNGGYPSVPLTHPAIFFINDTSTPGHDPEVYAKKTSATVAVGDGTRRRSGRAKPSGGVGVPALGFYMEDSGENGEPGSANGGVGGGPDNGGTGTTGGRAERGARKLKRFVGPRTFAVLASEAAVAAATVAANSTAAIGSSSASSSSSTSSFAPTKSAPLYVPREPKTTTKKPAARSRAFKAPFARLSETPLPKTGSHTLSLPPVHSSSGSTSTILAPTVTSLFVGGVDLGCIPPFEGELPAGTWSTKDSFARRSDKERKARVKIAVQKRMEQMGLPASLIPGAQAQAIKGMLSEEGTRRPGNVVSLIKPGFAHVASGPGGKGGDPTIVLMGSPGETKLTAGQKAKRKEEELSIANEAAELAKLKPATVTAPAADVLEEDERLVAPSMDPILDLQRPTKRSKMSPPLLSNPVSIQTDLTLIPSQDLSPSTQPPLQTSSHQQPPPPPPPSPPKQLLPPTFSVNDALSNQQGSSFGPLHLSPSLPPHLTSLNLASSSTPASNLSLILNPTEPTVANQTIAVKKKGPSIRLKLGGLGPSTERASSVPIASVAKSMPSTFSVASAPSSSSTPSSSAPSSTSSSLSPPSSSAPLPTHSQNQTSLAPVLPSNFSPILVSIPSSSFLSPISTATTAALDTKPSMTSDSVGRVADSSMGEDGLKKKRKGRGKAKPKTSAQLGAGVEGGEGEGGKVGKNGGRAIVEVDGKKAGFKTITKNTYPNRAKDLAQPSECECRPPSEWRAEDSDRGDLIDACGEHCINRAMQYLCHPKNCRFGETCSNKSLYKRTGPSIKVFSTTDRGYIVKAMEFIPVNSFVIDYRGEVVSTTEYYDRLSSVYGDRKESYAVDYGDGEVLDSGLRGNIARFINHGCDPNLRIEKWMTLGEGFEEYEVGFWTTRDIQAGEELFYDYNFDSFSTKINSTAAAQTGINSTPTSESTASIVPGRQRCLCGAACCTGWVGGAKQAAKELANVKKGEVDDELADKKSGKEPAKRGRKRKSLMS